MAKPIAALAPPARLLCGPGPTNVEPAALAAMGKPMLGHLDPAFHAILDEVVTMLAEVYRARDGIVLPLQSTGTSEIARRHGANVVEVAEEWGRHVPNERLVDALERNPGARLVAVVHGETSTGVEHPLAELGEAVRGTGALLMADCVTTLGGVRIDFDDWGLDYAYSCTQKCLGAPPGMSPLALSPRALDRIETRTRPVPFSLDLRLLRSYFVDRPAAYHHTAPILHVYALHEVLRQTLEEGVEQRWDRHEAAGRRFAACAEEAGLEVLAEAGHRLAPLTAVRVPEGIDGKHVQRRLLAERGLEVGGGLGAATPPIWRVGLMGPNANEDTADEVLAALTAVLEGGRVPVAG
jgi:alanine-glyoxylate transaminase/serine-glyoxylate transaminase/serine-pyruvate transaminase